MTEHRLVGLGPDVYDRDRKPQTDGAHTAICSCGEKFHGDNYDEARIAWWDHRDAQRVRT